MNNLFHHPVLTAVGSALLHSVWVFGLLSLTGQLTARACRDASRRHTVLLAVLLFLPMVFLVLVYLALPEASTSPAKNGSTASLPLVTAEASGLAHASVARATDWLPVLAVGYLLGLLLSTARTTWAYGRMLGLRRGAFLPGPKWRAAYLELRRSVAPASKAEWRWSPTVREVLTVGVWRPLILFPVGLVNELSPEEVQAVLRHELAHLRRRDPIWQALQQVIITLFYYHPMVHWLGRSLEREREYACDDQAAGASGRKTYARALLRVAQSSLSSQIPFTVAATDRSTFSHRLHRLFAGEVGPNRRGGYLFAPLLSLPLLLLLALGTVGTPADSIPLSVLTGTVTDARTGEPLIGATLTVNGTRTGTITDLNGAFKLEWTEKGELKLLIRYVGYISQEIIFDNVKDRELDIALSREQEVQDTGVNIRVRGLGPASFPDDVVILLDGEVVAGGLDDLEPSAIESVKVVKDKVEMAEMGVDTAKAGVVIIKTKR